MCASSKNKIGLGWDMPARHEAPRGEPAAGTELPQGRRTKAGPAGSPAVSWRLNFVTSHMPGAHSRAGAGPLGLCQIATPHKVAGGGGGCVLGCLDLALALLSGPQAVGECFNPGDAQQYPHNTTHQALLHGSSVDPEKKPPTFSREPQPPPAPTLST